MTFEQTIEVPADHRVFLDLPPELPVGKAKITLTAVLGNQDIDHALDTQFNNHDCPEELRVKLQSLRGSLGKNAFGNLDGIAYQNKVREEWDD